MDVASFLHGLGLEQYEQAFRDNAIDVGVLPDLTDADLAALGVLLGHRRKLLRAIAGLMAPAAGQPVVAPGEATPLPSSVVARAPEAERRQLTVMFCDLVASTELAARLDPEDMSAVIRAYQNRCREMVGRWGGHVAKYMGDGVLTYFGWPSAHEDEAERAVRAGLELVEAVRALDAPGFASDGGRETRQPLAARVGIASF
jgi:class 3 adenylate cyclase